MPKINFKLSESTTKTSRSLSRSTSCSNETTPKIPEQLQVQLRVQVELRRKRLDLRQDQLFVQVEWHRKFLRSSKFNFMSTFRTTPSPTSCPSGTATKMSISTLCQNGNTMRADERCKDGGDFGSIKKALSVRQTKLTKLMTN